ncbi:MAG: hypothetical protein AB7L84_06020 [Acidimicrobiia bacterium]
MIVRSEKARRIGRVLSQAGAVASAGMLMASTWALTGFGASPAAAAAEAGTAQVVHPADGTPEAGQPISGGGTLTAFSILPPLNAACTGDSALGGYRVQSYMVEGDVDPATLTFDAFGPVPNTLGVGFRQPLYTTTSAVFVDASTADASTAGGPGPVINVPGFDLAVFVDLEPDSLPLGVYNLGVACTLGGPSETQLDKFWNVQIEIVEGGEDDPLGIAWTVVEADPGSTTTTTTDDGSTTTTTGDGTTTTTAGGSTTSTTAGGSTTSTTTSSNNVLGSGSGVSGTGLGSSLSNLPATGASVGSPLIWAALLLVFGRIAMLLARPVKVRPSKAG